MEIWEKIRLFILFFLLFILGVVTPQGAPGGIIFITNFMIMIGFFGMAVSLPPEVLPYIGIERNIPKYNKKDQ